MSKIISISIFSIVLISSLFFYTPSVKADDSDKQLRICNDYMTGVNKIMIKTSGKTFPMFDKYNMKWSPIYDGFTCGTIPTSNLSFNIFLNPKRVYVQPLGSLYDGWCINLQMGKVYKTSKTVVCK